MTTLSASASQAKPIMGLPDFLVIGAAKSGTSTLHELLGKHPQVYVSRVKEPEFFAVDCVFKCGLDWYRQLFKAALPGQLCCEASTAYTRWPQFPRASERIFQTLPNVKLIYIMRHPIDRAYSHYVHRLTRELFPHQPIRRTFEEHIKSDPMCLDGSRYMVQIEQYMRYFPRESLCLLLTEDLEKDSQATVRKAWKFLDLPDVPMENSDVHGNDGESIREGRIRRYVMEPFNVFPVVRNLKGVVPKSWSGRVYSVLQESLYGQWVKRRHTPPKMLLQTRKQLVEEFRPLNDRLSEFMGRDLSHWNR